MSTQRFSECEIVDRRTLIGKIFVDHPGVVKVTNDLDEQLRYGTIGSTAKLTMLLAESGCGKTSAILNFVNTTARPQSSSVVVTRLPIPCTIKGMTCEMLRQLGDPLWDRTSTTNRNSFRIIHHLREQQVRLLIIDEFQHLLDHDRDKVLRQTTDRLKSILDGAGVPVVCVGLPNALDIIRTNPQLERRTTRLIAMHPFGWDGGDETMAFRAFLQVYEEALPFSEPSNLSNPSFAKALHQGSGGLVGRVSQLICEATLVSVTRSEGPDCLTGADFAQAYAALPFGKRNPFGFTAGRQIAQ